MKSILSALNHSLIPGCKIIAIAGMLLFINTSCYYDVIVTEEIEEAEKISFSNDIIPVLKANCTSCHNGEVALPNLQKSNALNALINGGYLSYTDGEESSLVRKIRSGHPYDGALTETEIQKLVLWMEAGAANN